jgi:hypothetical protein
MGGGIRNTLRDDPFASLRTITKVLGISPETVWLHLLQIGQVMNALHWVPHTLTDDPKLIRVEKCRTMLAERRVQKHNQWHNIVTGDEIGFILNTFWIACGSFLLALPRIIRIRQLRWRNIC